jgi:hypothetical protein
MLYAFLFALIRGSKLWTVVNSFMFCITHIRPNSHISWDLNGVRLWLRYYFHILWGKIP